MKKAAVVLLALVAVLVIAPAAFAQTAPEAAKPAINTTTIVIAIGFGVAVAALLGYRVLNRFVPHLTQRTPSRAQR